MDYTGLSDEELVVKAQLKDSAAMDELIARYKSFVKKCVRPYFLVGGDTEDLIQEGMVGVFRAVETFNGKSSFRAYVYSCVKNGIITLIKKYNSEKNKPLNGFISLSGDDDTAREVAASATEDPETRFLDLEAESELIESMKNILSRFEFTVFRLFLDGYSYAEISDKLKKNEKSIDNALQRIKKKVDAVYGG